MDIDIDFADRTAILSKLQHHVAALETGKKHNTGIYVTPVPHNPIDNIATIDYKIAEDRGYFKIDFLNVNIYKDVNDEEHLTELLNKEPLAGKKLKTKPGLNPMVTSITLKRLTQFLMRLQ